MKRTRMQKRRDPHMRRHLSRVELVRYASGVVAGHRAQQAVLHAGQGPPSTGVSVRARNAERARAYI